MADISQLQDIQSKLTNPDFDLYTFMDFVVNRVQELTAATGAVIELVDGDDMVYRATSGSVKDYLGLRLPIGNSISGLCVKDKMVLRSDDTESDPRVNLDACRKVRARSLLVVPLFKNDRIVGVLKVVSDKPNAFNDDHVKMLEQAAAYVASGIAYQMMQEFRNFL